MNKGEVVAKKKEKKFVPPLKHKQTKKNKTEENRRETQKLKRMKIKVNVYTNGMEIYKRKIDSTQMHTVTTPFFGQVFAIVLWNYRNAGIIIHYLCSVEYLIVVVHLTQFMYLCAVDIG